MTARATAIVRARAVGAATSFVGSTIYTRTRFQVLERWKGPEAAEVEVFTPGGAVGRTEQHYTGVPQFRAGQELVLFLWTGRSGRTQVIGYSQGVYEVSRSSAEAEAEAIRHPGGEALLAPGSGAPERDPGARLPLRHLQSRVRAALERREPK